MAINVSLKGLEKITTDTLTIYRGKFDESTFAIHQRQEESKKATSIYLGNVIASESETVKINAGEAGEIVFPSITVVSEAEFNIGLKQCIPEVQMALTGYAASNATKAALVKRIANFTQGL